MRKKEIDILKGIGIVLMIMGHIEFGSIFDKYIHSFHIPLFFLVSGYLHKSVEQDYGKWFAKRVRSLILPYLSFGLIYLSLAAIQVLFHMKSVQELYSHIFHFIWINTSGLPIAGAIWYLTSFFFVEIIFFSIEHTKIPNIFRVVIVVFLFLVGFILGKLEFRLPFGLDVSMVCLLFYYFGFEFKKIGVKAVNTPFVIDTLMFVLASALVFVNASVNFRTSNYGNPLLLVINATTITYYLYILCIKLKVLNVYVISEISFIGENSIVYLCMNEFFLYFLKLFIRFSSETIIINVFIRLSILLFSLFLLHISTLIISKTKISFIIGKKSISHK